MGSPSFATFHEIADIITSIKHVIISTLENIGKSAITGLDPDILHYCLIILRDCDGTILQLDGFHWSTIPQPVQGLRWQGESGGDTQRHINADLLRINIPDWIRRYLLHSITQPSLNPNVSLSKKISTELYEKLSPLSEALVSCITAIPRSKDTKRLRDLITNIKYYINILRT